LLYNGWGNVGGYHNKHHSKPKTIVELHETLQMISDDDDDDYDDDDET